MNEKILVVDDEPIVTEVVEKYLVHEGYRVAVVRDGAAALAAVESEAPDLIVLDLMLPKVDGLEVCRHVRGSSQVPIIMLTAKDDEQREASVCGRTCGHAHPRRVTQRPGP